MVCPLVELEDNPKDWTRLCDTPCLFKIKVICSETIIFSGELNLSRLFLLCQKTKKDKNRYTIFDKDDKPIYLVELGYLYPIGVIRHNFKDDWLIRKYLDFKWG